MKKFSLTSNTRIKFGRKLIQIQASIDFGDVKKGDLGGWIEDEKSLKDGVWIYENAEVFSLATIHSGEIWGGEIHSGVIRGGVIWGGEIRGGEIWGGVIWGGVIRGGEIRGGEIQHSDDYIAFCSIGSDNGILTAYLVEGDIEITRGCFKGSLKAFEQAVKAKHKNNGHAKEYKIAIDLIKLRFAAKIKLLKAKK